MTVGIGDSPLPKCYNRDITAEQFGAAGLPITFLREMGNLTHEFSVTLGVYFRKDLILKKSGNSSGLLVACGDSLRFGGECRHCRRRRQCLHSPPNERVAAGDEES